MIELPVLPVAPTTATFSIINSVMWVANWECICFDLECGWEGFRKRFIKSTVEKRPPGTAYDDKANRYSPSLNVSMTRQTFPLKCCLLTELFRTGSRFERRSVHRSEDRSSGFVIFRLFGILTQEQEDSRLIRASALASRSQWWLKPLWNINMG